MRARPAVSAPAPKQFAAPKPLADLETMPTYRTPAPQPALARWQEPANQIAPARSDADRLHAQQYAQQQAFLLQNSAQVPFGRTFTPPQPLQTAAQGGFAPVLGLQRQREQALADQQRQLALISALRGF